MTLLNSIMFDLIASLAWYERKNYEKNQSVLFSQLSLSFRNLDFSYLLHPSLST